jgi:hypothetical protein
MLLYKGKEGALPMHVMVCIGSADTGICKDAMVF